MSDEANGGGGGFSSPRWAAGPSGVGRCGSCGWYPGYVVSRHADMVCDYVKKTPDEPSRIAGDGV